MNFLVNNYLICKIWDTGTEISAVMVPKLAIICRPDHKRAKNLKICTHSNSVAQKVNWKTKKAQFDEQRL